MKKILSIILALAMVLAMGAVAFADTITISADITGDENKDLETYTAYKVLDVTKSKDDDQKVSYTIETTSKWYPAVSKLTNYVSINDIAGNETTKSVILKEELKTPEEKKAFAEALIAAARAESNFPTDFSATAVIDDKNKSAEVSTGYYLIESSLGSALILGTTDINIEEKNDYPSLTKAADKTTASIGDTVTYTITVAIPETAVGKAITVFDAMDSSLSYTAGDFDANGVDKTAVTESAESTPAESEDYAGMKTRTWTFTAPANVKSIVITYPVMVSETAPMNTAIANKAHVSMSNYTSADVEVDVKTYEFTLVKTDEKGAPLDGAKFQLKSADNVVFEFHKDEKGNYIKNAGEETRKADDPSTIEVGSASIKGLAAGEYTLIETEAPAGYNPLQSAITVKIAEDGTVSVTAGNGNTATADNGTVTVQNSTGILMPETGSAVTMILYILGGCVLVGACVYLVIASKRKNAAK